MALPWWLQLAGTLMSPECERSFSLSLFVVRLLNRVYGSLLGAPLIWIEVIETRTRRPVPEHFYIGRIFVDYVTISVLYLCPYCTAVQIVGPVITLAVLNAAGIHQSD